MNTVKGSDLAKYIISRCLEKNCPTTNLRLQYYLYLSRIEYFKRYKKELCDTEMVCREYGPTSLDVYYDYTMFSGNHILLRYDVKLPEDVKSVVDDIIRKYHDIEIYKLIKECKKSNSPYSMALEKYPMYPKITLNIIESYIESELILNIIKSFTKLEKE